MEIDRYELARILHEARVRLAWGAALVATREPFPDFGDPVVRRGYSHNPIAYVDLALAQADAAVAFLARRETP